MHARVLDALGFGDLAPMTVPSHLHLHFSIGVPVRSGVRERFWSQSQRQIQNWTFFTHRIHTSISLFFFIFNSIAIDRSEFPIRPS